MCGSSYQPMMMSGPVPRFAASAALGRTSSQVMYSTLTGTPVSSVNFLVFAFQSSSSDLTKPDQRSSRRAASFSGLKAGSNFAAWLRARPAASPTPQPSTVRRGILRMHPPGGNVGVASLRFAIDLRSRTRVAPLTPAAGGAIGSRGFSPEGEDMKTSSLVFAIALASSTAALANVKTDTIKVSGWKCEKCPAKTEAKLKQVNGVESASADREKAQVIVKYDDTKAKPADLEKAVADSGFAVAK